MKWHGCHHTVLWKGRNCYNTVLCLRQKCHLVYTPIIATLHLAWRLTLARRGRLSNILAWCHHAQMSAWQGCAVPCRLLHTGHRCCWQAASQVGHTANDGGATTSAIHCWPLSIHRACKAPWSGTPCPMTSAHSRTMSPVDSVWKPGFSLATSVLSALETAWQLRYINSHLPYHTIPYHTSEVIHSQLPQYFRDDCQLLTDIGHRSCSQPTRVDACTGQRTRKLFGDRSFSVAGPHSVQLYPCGATEWQPVRHFLRDIWTHCCLRAYS